LDGPPVPRRRREGGRVTGLLSWAVMRMGSMLRRGAAGCRQLLFPRSPAT
jgi:hypothetical protein